MTDGQELNRYKLENADLKKRVEEAEGELAIIKGIGNKSPEMQALKKENNELAKMNDIIREEAQVIQLKADKQITELQNRLYSAEEVNQAHQKLNGELRKDNEQNRELLRESVKELADHKDLVKTYRKAGVL